MLNHLKTLAILALAASAVYLTALLWFNELSGVSLKNAMLVYFSRAQPETEAEQNFFIKPSLVVTAFGDSTCDIIYNGIDSSAQKRDCDEAITLALGSGEYIGSTAADLGQLLSSACYAYGYATPMPAEVFVKSYAQRRSLLTSRVRSFNWVFVKPRDGSLISVIFLDTDGRAYEYSVSNFFLEQRVSGNIAALAEDGSRLRYAYARDFFIPQIDNFVYDSVRTVNPYMDQGGLLLDYIKRRVDVFFGSAGSKMESSTPQSFTYSDETTVVRYFPAESQNGLDVLDYANYSVIDRRLLTTLSADYNTAARFISRDPAITNEYYLASLEDTESRRVFRFNYAVNDLPVLLSNAHFDQTGLNYPIEITVENGVVTRYRKLVYAFAGAESEAAKPETAVVAFDSVLSDLLAVGESPADLPVSEASLGYKIDTGDEMVLYWFLDLDGMKYTRSAQGSSEVR